MTPALGGDFAQLVVHALAHVPLPGPGSLYEPRYVAWSAAALPREATEPARRDADVIAARYGAVPDALALHVLPSLHASIAGFLRSAAKPVEALGPGDVDDPEALSVLLALDRVLVELCRAVLGLAAPAYLRAYAAVVEPELGLAARALAIPLEAAERLLPALGDVRVELVHGLGARGRGLRGRVLVGAPAPWNDLDPALPAVVALHERAVQLEPRGAADRHEDYVRAEHGALVRLARLMQGAPARLRAAHAAWLGALDLGPLLRDAAALGLSPLAARA